MITPFVIDASVLGNLCFDDERTPQVESLFLDLAATFAEAPALLYFELQALLRKGEKNGRIQPQASEKFWADLGSFDIRLHNNVSLVESPNALHAARLYGLTAYDASYLRLAMDRNLPLATKDDGLKRAARAAGVPLLLP